MNRTHQTLFMLRKGQRFKEMLFHLFELQKVKCQVLERMLIPRLLYTFPEVI